DDNAGHTDDTGTITVNVGVLHHITIRDAAGGGGDEVGTHTMTTDETLTVFAAGYDADNNFISDISVTWSGTGIITGNLSPTTGTSTTFDPTTTGTGTIHADDGAGHTDDTGTITVNVGVLHHITIRDAQGGKGDEVGTHTMTTDETLTVFAAGYDADNNYIGDISVTWTGTGVVEGNLSPTTGTSTTFDPTTTGTGTIHADDNAGHTYDTGTITVNVGVLHHITIRDAAGGGGDEVGTHTMTTDETLTVFAAGYDADNNYIGDIEVTWTGTGVVEGNLSPTTGTSTTFNPTTTGTGTIHADDNAGHTDDTGTITVNVGVLHHIIIRDAKDGKGDEVGTHTMTTDETLTVFAAGYDADNNFISDISVTWSGTGIITGNLSPTTGTSTTFDPTTTGTGTIHADDGAGHTDDTGTITVNVGATTSIKIEDLGGREIGDHIMTTDDTLTCYARRYDAKGNKEDISVAWSTTSTLNPIPAGPSTNVTFDPITTGTGTIHADDGAGHTDDTGTITVNVGVLHHIIIRDAKDGKGDEVGTHTMTTDETLTVFAAGYDADNNYIGDISVTWTGTGVVEGNLSPTTGTSTTFNPTTTGTGTIHADDNAGHTDDTGTITVNVGVLH
ncbi:MAG: hypothetical protein QME14_09960, partial [Methanobacteriaceae archaeon]|nr:hypothetical protein [Methanobacteriaceae archaeon]